MIRRRCFLESMFVSAALGAHLRPQLSRAAVPKISVASFSSNDDIFSYLNRKVGQFDLELYKQLLGAANEFKEGDEIVGVCAEDSASRTNARRLLANTKASDIDSHPVLRDQLYDFIMAARDPRAMNHRAAWTLGQWKTFLLTATEAEIHAAKASLSSDVMA